MPKFKVKQGDETVEVEYDEIVESPEGLLPASQVEEKYVPKDHFESEIQRRVSSAKTNERKAVKEDEEFLREVATSKWGLEFEDGKPKTGSDIDVEQVRQSVRESLEKDEIEPLRRQNEMLKTSQLSSEVLREATRAGVKKEKLEEVYKGRSLLELRAQDELGFDPETGMWAVRKGEEGFEYSANPEGNRPYKGVTEWIKSLPDDWFEDQTQGGSNYRGNGQGGSSGKKWSDMGDSERLKKMEQWRKEGKNPQEEAKKLMD